MGFQETKSKPWLDNKGQLVRDNELKLISRNWCEETWEDYLSYIETPRTESILNYDYYHNLSEVLHLYDDSDAPSPVDTKLLRALENLTEKQKEILFLTFWEGFSTRRIALRMNISCAAVQKTKDRALNSLKGQIEGVNALRIMKGMNSKPFMKRGEAHGHQHFRDTQPEAS